VSSHFYSEDTTFFSSCFTAIYHNKKISDSILTGHSPTIYRTLFEMKEFQPWPVTLN